MRIAYDVTPLSHPRTGVGNYILGALKGMLEAPGPEHEIVAFGPASIRGRGLLDETLDGLPIEKRLLTVPFAPRDPARVGCARAPARGDGSSAGSTSCTSPTGWCRRSVPACARR